MTEPLPCSPVGDVVVTPDGRTGQVWSVHENRTSVWVALPDMTLEAYPASDLQAPRAATPIEQEGLPL